MSGKLYAARIIVTLAALLMIASFIGHRIIARKIVSNARYNAASNSGAAQKVAWQKASDHYGRVVTVEGRIVASHNTGKVCFLNFDRDYRRYLTAVIFASRFHQFPGHPEKFYINKTVRVSGRVKEYNGKPEIVLDDPAQITVLD